MQTLLITVDSLRADHLGQYGYHRDTMPALDRLADDGTTFRHAFANGAYTRISVPSFLTSRHLAYEALDSFPTIASVLDDEGIRTAVVGTQTGIGLVDSDFRFGETIDLGRDEYYEEANKRRPAEERLKYEINRVATRTSQFLQRRGADRLYDALRKPYNALFNDEVFRYLGYTSAEVVTDRAIEWLEEHSDSEFFLWIHYMEAHRPYGVHDDDPQYLNGPVDESTIQRLMETAGLRPDEVSDDDRRLMRNLYDSDLRYCSRHLDRLFERLERMGLWSDANILFSSDHGEEFYEHGNYFHRNYPYDELSHVPLIMKAPSAPDLPSEVEEQRELLDLAPTIAAFHDVDPAQYDFTGEPLFRGDPRRVFSLGQPSDAAPAVTLRTPEWKFIASADVERLYDLDTDPDEQRNVTDEHPAVAGRLRDSIPDRLLERDVNRPRAPDDDVDKERLEALGYLELRE